MRYFLLLAVFLSFTAFAQKKAIFAPIVTIDTTKFEVVFEQYLADTIVAQNYLGNCILSVGDNWAKYEDYNRYLTDSISAAKNYDLTQDEYSKTFWDHRPIFKDIILSSLSNNTYFVHTNLYSEFFTYKDSDAVFRWSLSDDTATICTFLCQKAETTFRGIKWTAWYSPDIQSSFGPWKFNGLPGLILKVEDAEGLRSFCAVSLRKPKAKTINQYFNEIETTVSRQKFIETEKFAAFHFDEFFEKKHMRPEDWNNPNVPKRKRAFFCPLEKE